MVKKKTQTLQKAMKNEMAPHRLLPRGGNNGSWARPQMVSYCDGVLYFAFFLFVVIHYHLINGFWSLFVTTECRLLWIYHNLFTKPCSDGYLGCLWFFAAVNNAIIKIFDVVNISWHHISIYVSVCFSQLSLCLLTLSYIFLGRNS